MVADMSNESGQSNQYRSSAVLDFQRARRRARRAELNARLRGRGNRLLPFDEIRAELRAQNPLYEGIRQIPLADIIGSVGRYNDFTREFLPLTESMRERWVNLHMLSSAQGWPPIELYQIGNAYFVRDGNHRVAVAHEIGMTSIEAKVWAFPDELELDASETLDDVLIELGAKRFEERTKLNELFPDHGIAFTAPGRYSELYTQIKDIQEKIGRIDGESISYEDAVPIWYEIVYLPTIQIIIDEDLVSSFPGRTIADLYVWLSIHRTQLGERYGEFANVSELTASLAERYKQTGFDKMARQVRNMFGAQELPPLDEGEALKANSTP